MNKIKIYCSECNGSGKWLVGNYGGSAGHLEMCGCCFGNGYTYADHAQEQYDALFDLYLVIGCEYADTTEYKWCRALLEVGE